MTDFNFLKSIIESALVPTECIIESTTKDGRLTSAESESPIVEYIISLFKTYPEVVCETPKKRKWYDLLITYHNKKYPINLKSTTGKSADNISSKQGMFFALTGLWPDDFNINYWETFNRKLLENFNADNNEDYYFIIHFKKTNQLFFTSLKRINILVSNGNNLPFQCKWDEINLIYTSRSSVEQCNYIMKTFIQSFMKRTPGLEYLLAWEEKNE